MFVREAAVCLDCDTIYDSREICCPHCLSMGRVELKTYFPAKDITTREEIDRLVSLKKDSSSKKRKNVPSLVVDPNNILSFVIDFFRNMSKKSLMGQIGL